MNDEITQKLPWTGSLRRDTMLGHGDVPTAPSLKDLGEGARRIAAKLVDRL